MSREEYTPRCTPPANTGNITTPTQREELREREVVIMSELAGRGAVSEPSKAKGINRSLVFLYSIHLKSKSMSTKCDAVLESRLCVQPKTEKVGKKSCITCTSNIQT